MITFSIYPNLKVHQDQTNNPYIKDFIAALNKEGISKVINPPHKNPLLSLLKRKYWGKVWIFNWFESIPDYKYGPLQAVIACVLLIVLKLTDKKIIWVLHNRCSHATGYEQLKSFLARFISHRADLILTHSLEGIEIVRQNYPYAINKTIFMHHPTQNRLPLSLPNEDEKIYDLLIWGTITPYKGVLEFLSFSHQHSSTLRICIIGKCASENLKLQLQQYQSSYVTLIFKGVSFEELKSYIAQSHFVLAPYAPQSILSSGMLMDSLSFGAKVIGPAVGSFKDYSHEKTLKVYTFEQMEDIARIVHVHKEDKISLKDYQNFLDNNQWKLFAPRLITHIQQHLKIH